MKDGYLLLCKSLAVVLTGCILLGSSGCQKGAVEESSGPVFFPGAPDQPKLQFLTSFRNGEKFDFEKPSFLETFVLGEGKLRVGRIVKPYGVAMHDGKIYVCDVGDARIKVMDFENNTFTVFPSGRSVRRPVNIFIDPNGTKYIADSLGGAISVWNADDKVVAYVGKDLNIKPISIAILKNRLFLTDANSNQVLVLDKRTGKLLERLGRGMSTVDELADDAFSMIADLAVDSQGSVYVSDKMKSMVTKFGPSGAYVRSFGGLGGSPDSLVRPKGIAFDREDRMWVVDAGPATAVKIFRKDGQLLLLFGFLGTNPGQMYLPAGIHIDYDHVDLFKDYAVKGAKLEFLVLVTNQFGPHRVSVYGFGNFPEKYSQPFVDDTSANGESEEPVEKGESASEEQENG
ncbi:MAG: hypothetical protein V3W44_07890 [Dehalococcoidales bacterium]